MHFLLFHYVDSILYALDSKIIDQIKNYEQSHNHFQQFKMLQAGINRFGV